MKKLFTREVKIAIVAILGVIVLFYGLNYLKGMSIFSNKYTYFVQFTDISGLSSSNPIYADGYQVGVVKGIQYNYNQAKDILVEIEVDNNLRIPKGSSAEIVSDFMGNVKMNILMANNPHERMVLGDTIVGVINGGALAQAASMMPTVQQMLPKLDSILTKVNQLLANPAIAQTLANAQQVSANLTTTTQQLNTLMAGLNKNVPGMMTKVNSVLDHTNRLTANLAAVDVAGTMAKVDATIANVQSVTAKLNSNEGSLGLLMNDARLYNNLNATMLSADSLLNNLREHPKRYVHFSVFGRKDK
uniref:MlaD family protein n=1 Tax=Prevotella sp. GTC17259 TaxID=3236795 RepID=A0AB33J6D0_9BACT